MAAWLPPGAYRRYAQALSVNECTEFHLGVLPPAMDKGLVTQVSAEGPPGSVHQALTVPFPFKPVTLEADFKANRVRMCFGPGVTMTSAQFQASTLLLKVLGITSVTLSTLETTMATDAGDANDTTTVINTTFRVITTAQHSCAVCYYGRYGRAHRQDPRGGLPLPDPGSA
eukprot:COSAG01_NODE_2880_length_6917_cov_3.067908_4_plen_171_part_00